MFHTAGTKMLRYSPIQLDFYDDCAQSYYRDHGWSYDSQVRSDVFCHADVRCFYLKANKTAYIYITKAFDQSEPRNRLLG